MTADEYQAAVWRLRVASGLSTIAAQARIAGVRTEAISAVLHKPNRLYDEVMFESLPLFHIEKIDYRVSKDARIPRVQPQIS